jgi:hypothetical protein
VAFVVIYKFKSKAAGDLIMLEPNGRRALQIMGKEPSAQGIITPDQMLQAVSALQSAVEQEEAEQKATVEQAKLNNEPLPILYI